MGLSARFLRHAPSSPPSSPPLSPEELAALDERLDRLVRAVAAEWPGTALDPERFVDFLGRHVDAATPATIEGLRAADLYLVHAYGLGIRAAHDAIESRYMPRVRRALVRLGTPAAAIADIEQELRQRLVAMQDRSSSRQGYGGRGELTGWLVLCAVRAAGLSRRRAEREPPLEQAADEVLPAAGRDAEIELLTRRYKEPFQVAFRAAVAALSSRERNLLRYRFLSGLGVDEIARVYAVHRATAARWVVLAQERLAARTRALFLERVAVDDESVPSIVAAIDSQLSMDLSAILVRAVEPEPDPGPGPR